MPFDSNHQRGPKEELSTAYGENIRSNAEQDKEMEI